MKSYFPAAALVAQDQDHLGGLAMRFRGTRDAAERTAIAADYAATVARLAASGAWEEIPAPEDQLPDDWMPPQFFTFWSPPEPTPAAPAFAPTSRAAG